MIEKLGGRKILLGLFVMFIGVLVDSFAKNGLSANLLDLLKFIGVGFFLGNGIEHVATAVKTRGTSLPPPSAPTVDTSAIEAKLEEATAKATEVSAKVDSLAEANATTQQGISYIIKAAGLDQSQAEKNRAAIR